MARTERYRILGRLGVGGLGVVHRVEDQATGQILAMKEMPRTAEIGNLRTEFLTLARAHHDNVVRVFDFGLTESGQEFLTMELVEGPALLEAVPEVPSPTFYGLLSGVLQALAFLHARGLVHADIKPSNILVDAERLRTDPSKAARLVDFGLAAALADPTSSSARGTFPYAAPEVYAGRLDARSDLYSLGVVLYEWVAGVQPYTGNDVAAVIAAQRQAAPRNPRELRPALPADLCDLIVALLDPAPGVRPQTADEVLARINEIAGTDFAVTESRPLVDLTGLFVGRERDLAELRRMWAEARQGRGGVALLCGEEGIGKTRLVAELKLAARLDDGRVFSSDAGASSDSPYGGLTALVRAMLVELSNRTPDEADRLREALAPILGAGSPRPETDPERGSRFALAEAVVALVLSLAKLQPLVIAVDNAHLADGATVEVFGYLARSVAETSSLLVLAAREAPPSQHDPAGERAGGALARIAAAVSNAVRGERFDLPPLDRHSVYRLAEQAFGADIARTLGNDLFRTSGGNAAHAARALEAMVASGTIARQRGAWVLTDESPEIPVPPDARTAALARAEQLPEARRRLLAAAAVLGETFSREVLAALVATADDAEAADVDGAVTDWVAARLVSADPSSGRFRFAHAGLVSDLGAALTATERDDLHRRAALILEERRAKGLPFSDAALVGHYLALSDERAVEAGMRAAAERAQLHDHHGALDNYQRIRPLITDPEKGCEVDRRLGDLHALLGNVQEARDCYRRAYVASDHNPETRIRLAERLGELERRLGDGDAALDVLMKALDDARRHRLPAQEARCHLRIGWVLMYRAEYKAAMEHAVAGHLIAQAAENQATSAELGRLRAMIEVYAGEPDAALAHLAPALADAEATGDADLVAGVLHATGRAAIHAGDYERASDALENAIAISERIGHIEQTARSLNNLGAACYFQGDWQRARSSWERFRQLCERLDEQSELVNALNNLGSLYRGMGQFAQAMSALERGAQVADATGHAHMAAMILANRGEVLFRQGDLAGARDCYDRALEEFDRIGAQEDIIETQRRLCELDIAAGKIAPAIERAVEAARAAQDAGARREEGILHRVAASALRLQGDLESAEWFADRAREILDELGAGYELAKLDLEVAELCSARGQPQRAHEHLRSAIEAFSALGARWHLTRARARARAFPSRDSQRSSDDAVPRVGVDLLLELSQAAGNVEIEKLLEIALDRVLALTHFERGFILLLGPEGRPSERMRRARPGSKGFARDEAEFSGTIVRKVAASGEAISVSDIAEEDDLREQRSVVALGLRQIMCAPMRARGRVIGIVYIDSRRLSFDEHGVDLQFLEAFAAQLSLAIENARMRAEEQRQSELLAMLAHEVRNPLAGILGYADIGEEEARAEGSSTEELFHNIAHDADRLRRLVDNVLELARHETGNVEWSMAAFDIGELIADVVRSHEPTCKLKRISITSDTSALDRPAFGNPDRIMQVLSNLVGNAVKFTPESGRIVVSARHESVAPTDPEAPPIPASQIDAWTPMDPTEDAVQEFVRVDVRDNGPGMSPEVRARVFEKFAQAAGAKRAKGVGLGLYISREIILRHGGTLFVDSEAGKGSTFSFRIPVA